MLFRLIRCLSYLLLILYGSVAYTAAFQFYELGTPMNGTAGVGQAVIVRDASAAYFNPAGMIQLTETAFMLGTQAMLSNTNFSPNGATTIAGNNGSNAGALLPGISGYFVYDYAPRLKWGASLTMPYGGALNYDNHWVGRYSVQQMLLYTLNFNPAVAYQMNDWVSIGAGISIEYANLYQTAALPISSTTDGQFTLKADNTSPGANLGILLTPTALTKIGIAYRSQIIHNLRGMVSFMNVGTTPSATTKLVMPSNVIASISQRMTDRFTLLGELGWANWSSMVNSIINVQNYAAVVQNNWHDTYRIGVGGDYSATPALQLLAGASLDSSPTSSGLRQPSLPMDRQIRLGLGVAYALTKAAKLGVSYEYIDLGKASINNNSTNGKLAGQYERNNVSILQASLNVTC